MPEGGRQQTEMRQSQATVPSPQEGAAAIEGKALWHRDDPREPNPGTRGGHPSLQYPTLTQGLLGARGSVWLPAQPHCQAAGAEMASRGRLHGVAAGGKAG